MILEHDSIIPSALPVLPDQIPIMGTESKENFFLPGLPRSAYPACGECTYADKRDTVYQVHTFFFQGLA